MNTVIDCKARLKPPRRYHPRHSSFENKTHEESMSQGRVRLSKLFVNLLRKVVLRPYLLNKLELRLQPVDVRLLAHEYPRQ
jgi:hypothetical protein